MALSRAYIAGLGTTGSLIGLSLLTLGVLGALFAFQGWPGEASIDGSAPVGIDGRGPADFERARTSGPAGGAGGDRGGVASGGSGKTARGRKAAGADLIVVGGMHANGQKAEEAPAAGQGEGAGAGAGAGGGAAEGAGSDTTGTPPAGGESLTQSVEGAAQGAVDAVGQAVTPGGGGVAGTTQGLTDTVRGVTGGGGDGGGGRR